MEIEPYILIGGNSTRFGTDKATFEFEGEMLAARAARTAEEALPKTQARFVSKAPGSFFGRPMIADVYADRGAAGAIHAALANASAPWIFVLACDLPLATSDLIAKLSTFIDEEYGCVVPVQPDGRWQPLCAFYHVNKCLKRFEMAIAGADRNESLRSIAEHVEPRLVEFSEYADIPNSRRLLTNVNTLADLDGI